MESFNNSFALIIGIEDPELPSTQDATDIYNVLTNKKFAGYPKKNSILLTKKKATREGILNAFDDLIKKTDADSKVFLYYSGHGAIDERKFPASYYLQAEGWDINNPEKTGVRGDELKEKLNSIIAERLIFFFDCCHAQGMTEGPGLLDAGTKIEALEHAAKLTNPEGLVHDIDDEEGMAIISSCKDHQESLYFKGDRNSLFTAYLLRVLKGEHKSKFNNQFIKVLEVASYLVEEVPKDAARDDLKQNPFVNLQIDKNFELSRVPINKVEDETEEDEETLASAPKKEIKKVFRKSDSANNAIIFVHGFSGEAHESFGEMPDLLMREKQLDGWDMYPFGFHANINPEHGKEVWATVNDIKRISNNLSSAIKYKFHQYDRIAIVAHSLGGLVAQSAVLELNKEHKDRISHLLLFATPSNGITNDAIKKLWKNKIYELVSGQRFILSLRKRWAEAFNGTYPFSFKTITATKDDFVTADSSLKPFHRDHWVTVSGDHFSIVNVNNRENDSYQLILSTLTNNTFFNKYTNAKEINLILGEYDAIIRELEPQLKDLDEPGLETLIHALEGVGRSADAEQILKTHPVAKNDADMLQLLGDLYKRRYLDNSQSSDGHAAFKCYTKALKLAQDTGQIEQICKNAIDLAFLNLMMEEDYKDMEALAKIAIAAAKSFKFDKVWKLRALAEGNLYLNELPISKRYYKQVGMKATIKEKIEIYTNAYTAYTKLFDPKNEKDVYLRFLKTYLLS